MNTTAMEIIQGHGEAMSKRVIKEEGPRPKKAGTGILLLSQNGELGAGVGGHKGGTLRNPPGQMCGEAVWGEGKTISGSNLPSGKRKKFLPESAQNTREKQGKNRHKKEECSLSMCIGKNGGQPKHTFMPPRKVAN